MNEEGSAHFSSDASIENIEVENNITEEIEVDYQMKLSKVK